MKSQVIPYKGKQILVCAYNDFGANLVALTAEVNAVDAWIITQPLNSVLSVADVTRTMPTPQAVSLMMKSTSRTKDYLRKQAVVGLASDRSVLARLVSNTSGLGLRLFDTIEAANDWLVEE